MAMVKEARAEEEEEDLAEYLAASWKV